MFVFADANQDKAIEFITIMRYLGVGEICVSPKRIFVHESIHDEFVAKLEAELPKYQPGNPLEATTLMGPLARRDLMEKAISQTQDSIAGGA